MIIPDQYFKKLAIMFTKEFHFLERAHGKKFAYSTDLYDKLLKKSNFEEKDLNFIKHLSYSMVKNIKYLLEYKKKHKFGYSYVYDQCYNRLYIQIITILVNRILSGDVTYDEKSFVLLLNSVRFAPFTLSLYKIDITKTNGDFKIIKLISENKYCYYSLDNTFIKKNADKLKNNYEIIFFAFVYEPTNILDLLEITKSDIFINEKKKEVKEELLCELKKISDIINVNRKNIDKELISLCAQLIKELTSLYAHLIKEMKQDDIIDMLENNSNSFILYYFFKLNKWTYQLTEKLFVNMLKQNYEVIKKDIYKKCLTKRTLMSALENGNMKAVTLFKNMKINFNEKHRDLFCKHINANINRYSENDLQLIYNKFASEYIEINDDTVFKLKNYGIKIKKNDKTKELEEFNNGIIKSNLSKDIFNYIIEHSSNVYQLEKLFKKNKTQKLTPKAKGQLMGLSKKSIFTERFDGVKTTFDTVKAYVNTIYPNRNTFYDVKKLINEIDYVQ